MMKRFIGRWALGALAALVITSASAQGCNDLMHSGRSPAQGVEIFFFSTKFEDRDHPNSPEVLWALAGAGSSHAKRKIYFLPSETSYRHYQKGAYDSYVPPYHAPFVDANHIDPTQLDMGKMGEEGATVLFYEPNGQGGRRLCRWENWDNRVAKRGYDGIIAPLPKPLPPTVSPQYETHPVLKKWAETYHRVVIGHLRYDTHNRLIWYGESRRHDDLDGRDPDPKDPTDGWVARPYSCFLYDAQGRPSRTVDVDGRLDKVRPVVRTCEKRETGEAGLHDYFYDSGTGAYRGMRNQFAATNRKRIDLDGAEREAEARRVANAPAVPGKVIWNYRPDGQSYIVRGEWMPQLTNGFIETVHLETTLEAEGHAGSSGRYISDSYDNKFFRYWLYDHLLVRSVLDQDDPIAALKKLHRLRIQKWGPGPVYEHFTPQGILRHRLFTLGDSRTIRHEQFDETGRLKRIINLGLMTDKNKDYYYSENLAAYKDQIKVGPYLMYRVYEYDAAGKEKLVALSWYPRSPYDHMPTDIVDEVKKDIKRAWRNHRHPEKAEENNTFPPHFFGTPDGTVKWKDEASFAKHFDLYPKLESLKQWGEAQVNAN